MPLFCPLLHHVTCCCINRFQLAPRNDMPFCGGETMTPAWAQRQAELLSDCLVSPDVFHHMVDRLSDFAVPYQHALEPGVSQRNVPLYLAAIVSGSIFAWRWSFQMQAVNMSDQFSFRGPSTEVEKQHLRRPLGRCL